MIKKIAIHRPIAYEFFMWNSDTVENLTELIRWVGDGFNSVFRYDLIKSSEYKPYNSCNLYEINNFNLINTNSVILRSNKDYKIISLTEFKQFYVVYEEEDTN